MAHIDPIRKQIELVLGQKFGTQYVEKCPNKEFPERYSLSLHPVTMMDREEKRMLLGLPYVLTFRYIRVDDYIKGIKIYFRRHPKLIKI